MVVTAASTTGEQARGAVPQLVRVPAPEAGPLGDVPQAAAQVGGVAASRGRSRRPGRGPASAPPPLTVGRPRGCGARQGRGPSAPAAAACEGRRRSSSSRARPCRRPAPAQAGGSMCLKTGSSPNDSASTLAIRARSSATARRTWGAGAVMSPARRRPVPLTSLSTACQPACRRKDRGPWPRTDTRMPPDPRSPADERPPHLDCHCEDGRRSPVHPPVPKNCSSTCERPRQERESTQMRTCRVE